MKARADSRAKRPATAGVTELLDLDISGVGARGDGLAIHDGRQFFVPYTAPGDRVRARRRDDDQAELVELLAPGPHRATPPCPHFGPGKCGGCALQHLDDSFYADWKTRTLADTLERAGLGGFDLKPLARSLPHERRRAEFLVRVPPKRERRAGVGVTLGFHVRGSGDAIDIGPCPVLLPALESLLQPLRAFFAESWPEGARFDVLATALDDGVELVFTRAGELGLDLRQSLAAFAAKAGLARIATRTGPHATPETVVAAHPGRVTFGSVPVDLPAGAFLQASVTGERAIVSAVAAAIGDARSVADLYAGAGAIALSLAGGKRRIYAAERNPAAIAALDQAARRAGLGPQVRAETRDLVKRPLLRDELADFAAVAFDPPREGAADQARALAESKVPVVAAVSCNPATFVRDALLLKAGGYRLTTVTPIDQFLWSPHLELVGVFEK